MDKIIAYQNIIADLLKEYRSYLSNANLREKDDRFKIVIDNENQHYQLLVMGWKENKYRFNILLHLNIEDNKIWLQQNNTEWAIADELSTKGVPKKDIVLGFLSEQARAMTDFAVA